MAGPHVFMIAGEPSGDLHAASLAAALKERRPGIRLSGIGGDRLQDEGMDLLHHADQLSFMGFAEVVRHLPYLLRVMGDVRAFLSATRPDLVILVDYPGFNLRVAREAHALGIPVLYYIAPQVWAWHPERVRDLAAHTDRLACVLPFEQEFFARKGAEYGVDAHALFVGHPLLDAAVARTDPVRLRSELLLPEGAPILGLLPGSRRQEVGRMLPVMVRAAALLREERPDLLPVICAAPGLSDATYRTQMRGAPLPLAPPIPSGERYDPSEGIHLVRGRTYDILSAARGAFVTSGTATLEAGLLGAPMVIVYRLNPISWAIGRRRVKVPNVGLVNLVAGEEVVPERLQGEANPGALAAALAPQLADGPERDRVLAGLARVRERLGVPGAAGRAADLALTLLGPQTPG